MALAARITDDATTAEPQPTLDLIADAPPAHVVIEQLLEVIRLAEAEGKPVRLEQMANGIGVHHATLFKLLYPDKFKAPAKPSDDFAAKASAYLRLLRMRRDDQDTGQIVETSVTRRVAKLCDICQLERGIGMLISETSAGKTASLRAYAQGNPAAIYVPGCKRTGSVTGMIDAIWASSKAFRGQTKVFRDKWDDLVRGFTTSGMSARIILVDDAHVLNFGVLEVLRELHDQTGVGMVLAGTTRLQERVNLSGDAHQMYEQLRARVMISRVIRKPTPNDVESVARAWAPEKTEFTPGALVWLHQLSQRLGALRLVKAHVRMALRLPSMTGSIDEAHLVKAHAMLEDRQSSLA